jgi:aspartyl/asparaginyl beta-hydroxylase (cupin superfamily)
MKATLMMKATVIAFLLQSCDAFTRPFVSPRSTTWSSTPQLFGSKGFGSNEGFGGGAKKKSKKKTKPNLMDALEDKPKKKQSINMPSQQQDLLESLAQAASTTCIGQAVASSPLAGTPDADPFWELMPSLIRSRFPNTPDQQLQRVAGMIRHAVNPDMPLEDCIINNPWRPETEIHAYMPGLGETKPFHDPSQLKLCRDLCENYEIIKKEYEALLDDMENGGKDRFQSVTSMNYESGWRTLVLFYNGHRIEDFPYHLCPVTTRILESVPLAGRIAGFNRQRPQTGIPLHTDGNNMWLTCQMGIKIPDGQKAFIRVGPETRRWKEGECLLYDTTYEHETFNEHESQERVVLHVDFFNVLSMTPIEISVMQYIYSLREQFMKAEGVAKVGAQIL